MIPLTVCKIIQYVCLYKQKQKQKSNDTNTDPQINVKPRNQILVLPMVTISHKSIPNDHTSLCVVNTRSHSDSIAIHLRGSFPLVNFLYWLSVKMSLDRPKSHTLMILSQPRRMFLAAKSRCTYLLSARYSWKLSNNVIHRVIIKQCMAYFYCLY